MITKEQNTLIYYLVTLLSRGGGQNLVNVGSEQPLTLSQQNRLLHSLILRKFTRSFSYGCNNSKFPLKTSGVLFRNSFRSGHVLSLSFSFDRTIKKQTVINEKNICRFAFPISIQSQSCILRLIAIFDSRRPQQSTVRKAVFESNFALLFLNYQPCIFGLNTINTSKILMQNASHIPRSQACNTPSSHFSF